jgi:hypothetical protein
LNIQGAGGNENNPCFSAKDRRDARSCFGQTQRDVGEGEGVKKTFEMMDMFCGAGCESTRMDQAAEEWDMKIRLTAINH